MKITIHPRFRLSFSLLVWVLLALMGIGFVTAMIRYASGIGAISDLNNSYPWGFWVSFDLYTGIAISSGAFILASIVYIFDLQAFRPLVRPTLLTGLLGYIMEVIALMVDLGHPERIWHYFVYQNYTSFLFAVGIYVMVYSTVMMVEFAPAVFERLNWHKPAELTKRFMKPVVIIGAVISTLHQSSLGALMLIQPTRLHPLWWTPFLPLLFFVSVLGIGLAMTIFESALSSRYFKRGLEVHLLEKLAKAIPFVLAVYALLKFGELAWAGELGYLFTSSWMSVLFWAEILIGVVTPILLFSLKKARQSPTGLLVGAVVLLSGMILNRFNVSWFAVQHPDSLFYMPTFMSNVRYFPTLPEISVSLGIFSAGILAFGLAVKYLPVFEPEEHAPVREPEEHAQASAPMPSPVAGD